MAAVQDQWRAPRTERLCGDGPTGADIDACHGQPEG